MKIEVVFSGVTQKFLLEEKPFFPKIASLESACEAEDFNTVAITLNASLTSKLDWRTQKIKATNWVEKGFYLFWMLDFGSFDLIDQSHFLSLELAMEHFLNEIWQEFYKVSLGVSFFQGRIEHLSEAAFHDLKLISSRLPDDAACFLHLDTRFLDDAATYFSKIRQDLFGHFSLFLKGPLPEKFAYASPFLGWDTGASPLGFFGNKSYCARTEKKVNLGLFLPKDIPQEMNDVTDVLKKDIRILPEELFIYEWDGIDDLLVFSSAVDERALRKLMGFCASGGRVVTVGDPLHVANEISFAEYLAQE